MQRELFLCARLALALLFIVTAACSNQQVYTVIQEQERQECAKLPLGQYEECMAEVDETYDDYEKAREDMKNDSAKKRAHTGY